MKVALLQLKTLPTPEENLEKISEEIEKDKTEGIKSEIIYPQTQDTEYTAALIISQYCAAREKDYRDISLSLIHI